jgi:ribosomal protein S12 methylthiotransferase
VDSEHILTRLRAEGYEISPSYEGSDLVVINTCGFIDAAVEESLDAIGEALAENGKVIVTGCLGAKDDVVMAAHPQVLAVTGPHATEQVMQEVHKHLPKPHDPFIDLLPPQGIKLTPNHYAYLKISEGCNHRCTFCIIPSLRGDLVSRPIGDVMREAENLVNAGVKELLVVSQDTSAYGVDTKYRTGFWGGRPCAPSSTTCATPSASSACGCACTTCTLPQRRRHHPADGRRQDPALPRRALPARQPAHPQGHEAPGQRREQPRAHPPLARDLPRSHHPLHLHHRLPGETDADFEELLQFLEEAKLDRVGAFAYSPVEGAAANELPGAVPEEIREERRIQLMEFQEDISTERLERFIGREMTVLVDEIDEEGALARSPGDAPDIDGLVIIPAGEHLEPGEFARVRITDCDVHDLYAEPL